MKVNGLDIVDFPQAVALKKAGYPQHESWEYGQSIYDKEGCLCSYDPDRPERDKDSISAPTVYEAVRWFMKEKHYNISLQFDKALNSYAVHIHVLDITIFFVDDHESAYLYALDEILYHLGHLKKRDKH